MVSVVANAILWMWIFHPQWGLANAFLQRIGLPPLSRLGVSASMDLDPWRIEPGAAGTELVQKLAEEGSVNLYLGNDEMV